MLNWRDIRHIILLTLLLMGVVVAGLVSYFRNFDILERYTTRAPEPSEIGMFVPAEPVRIVANPVLTIPQTPVSVFDLLPQSTSTGQPSESAQGHPLPIGVCGLTLPCVP